MANTLEMKDILDYDIVLSYIDICISNRANYPKELMSNHSVKLNEDFKELRSSLVNKTISYMDAYVKANELISNYVDAETNNNLVYHPQVITMSIY
jgi:hypothetical protein